MFQEKSVQLKGKQWAALALKLSRAYSEEI